MPTSTDYRSTIEFVERNANAVTLSFLTRAERKEWFFTWGVMRFSASPRDLLTIRRLTAIAQTRAARYYSCGSDIDPVAFFDAYDICILACMTLAELRAWDAGTAAGNMNSVYALYQKGAERLSLAEDRVKRRL